MQYRRLGDSDLEVSEIGFGSWLTFTDPARRREAIACVHRALDLGVNFLDTANVYGRGVAETVLGEALAGMRRERYVLASKVFFPMSETDRGLSAAQIRKQLDASLRRLQVEYLDLYQCHRYDPDTPLEETLRALSDAVHAGKVRYVGFSEWPLDRVEAALRLPGVVRFVSSQPQYSLLHRQPEQGLLSLCEREGISQVVWSPLAQGVLTGKYLPDTAVPPESRAADPAMGSFLDPAWMQRSTLQAVQTLKAIATRAQVSLTQFALAWVLRQPNVAAAIVGASRPVQVDENVRASGLRIDPGLFREAERVLDGSAVSG